MSRLIICLVIGVLAGSCTLQGKATTEKDTKMRSEDLEGVYEFVSDTTVLTKPSETTEQRTSDEWEGIWFFENGRYSQTLMKKSRGWYPFPRNQRDLGYESSAGTYEVRGQSLLLNNEVTLNPFQGGRSTVYEYKIDGDMLTIIETKIPYMEDLSEGQQIIILKKRK